MLTILLALVITFALNRLSDVARSLPVPQGGLIVSLLIGARSAARFWHTRQIYIGENGGLNEQPHETVLIVGVNTITELFLVSVEEFAPQRLRVAGILAEESGMRGRAIHQKPVLGAVEELQEILQSLELHGVAVDRIVVTTSADRLGPRSLDKLLEIEKSADIAIQFLSERFGFEGVCQDDQVPSGQERNSAPRQRAVARVEA